MNEFNYAIYLANLLYNVDIDEDDAEEIGLIAYNKIGGNRGFYRKECLSVDQSDGSVELPDSVKHIEGVTVNSTSTSSGHPEHVSGDFVRYTKAGNKIYLARPYPRKVSLFYFQEVLGEDDLPMVTDKEAQAIACYIAYVQAFKDSLQGNQQSLQLSQTLEAKWLTLCDQARVPEYLSQNDMDKILDAQYSADRKVYGKSYKPI